MAVYVDKSRHTLGRMRTCHMIADTVEELEKMARAIGARPEWIQVSRSGVIHYDIPLFRKKTALELGVVELSTREFAHRCRELKAANQQLPRRSSPLRSSSP